MTKGFNRKEREEREGGEQGTKEEQKGPRGNGYSPAPFAARRPHSLFICSR